MHPGLCFGSSSDAFVWESVLWKKEGQALGLAGFRILSLEKSFLIMKHLNRSSVEHRHVPLQLGLLI